MTKEERAERERQKQWVEARLNCTTRKVFFNLASVVRHDVETYNASGRPAFRVADMQDGSLGILIEPVNPQWGSDHIIIKAYEGEIKITRKDDPLFTVEPQWDEDALKCNLYIDGEDWKYTFPQISQRAIGELLFKAGEFPKPRR